MNVIFLSDDLNCKDRFEITDPVRRESGAVLSASKRLLAAEGTLTLRNMDYYILINVVKRGDIILREESTTTTSLPRMQIATTRARRELRVHDVIQPQISVNEVRAGHVVLRRMELVMSDESLGVENKWYPNWENQFKQFNGRRL